MKADLIERLRAHPNKFIGHWEDWANEADTLLREAAAALEAEASEGERRGLERAVGCLNELAAPWRKEKGEYWDGYRGGLKDASEEVRALIPEAPTREDNVEDDPRYPALLKDALARGRGSNMDGSPRRHAVASPPQDREEQ